MPRRRLSLDHRRFLGTHDVAALLSVDSRTVVRWMDAGPLVAFKTPGGHRRIEQETLRRFIRERGWPLSNDSTSQDECGGDRASRP